MTVMEISGKLFEWFTKHDTFVLKDDSKDDDFKGIVLISDNPEANRAALLSALDEHVKADLVRVQKLGKATYWNLLKPFAAYAQTISLDAETCLALSQSINGFCEALQDKTDLCDPYNITCKDIRNLTIIAAHMSRMAAEQRENKEED